MITCSSKFKWFKLQTLTNH